VLIKKINKGKKCKSPSEKNKETDGSSGRFALPVEYNDLT
jgi:hypothetical protein